jgi:two-component system chemotaxis sensor kinase CheA
MDSSQYAELFLTESREHLTAINQWLLQLEREGAAASAEPVSAIFRAVHTVKGMSATMGYSIVAELSHELETLLDRVRRNELPVNAELMDLLFKAADVLEQAIEHAVSGRPVASEDILRRLRAFADPTEPAKVMPNAESAANEWTVPAPSGSGTLVRIQLVAEAPLRGVRAFLVVQALRRLGDVLVVNPSVSALQAEQFGYDFALRLATTVTDAEIERVARGAGDVAAVRVGEDVAVQPKRTAPAAEQRATRGEPVAAAGKQPVPITAAVTAPKPVDLETVLTVPNGAPDGTDASGVRQSRHVRIDLRRLDSLMNLIGELVITRGRLMQLSTGFDDPALADSVSQASRLIGDLRDEIMTSRMVPVWQVFDRFPRLVRDASRTLGKRIEFTIEGKEIELDRSMLDEIGDPIVHLLRNAIDHGIELPEDRVAAGKPAAGKLRLSAARDRSAVMIRVSDDGKGIDRERVLAKAKTMGLVDQSKVALSDDELVRIVGRPGFSTAERVTDMSGRGVGIDAVYTRVRSLGGAVDIRSSQGQGTTVTLRLPLTLAIVRALLARVANEVYAIPLTHVSETVELQGAALRTLQGREVLVLRSDVLPVLRLRGLVGLGRREIAAGQPNEQVIIIDLPDRRVGLIVDELAGQQEIVVKQYDGVKDGLSFFGGATILGTGSPALIVDVSSFP